MGDVEGIALTHNNLAELALDQGKISEAEASFNSSLSVSEPLKINFHQAKSYLGLVKTSLAQQHLKETARMLKVAFRQATEVDAREILAELMNLKAELFLANGEYDQAEKQYGAALQAAVEINNSGHESSARRVCSETKLRKGQPAQGVEILDEAWERLSKSVEELETGRVHAQYARLYNALGDPEKTDQHRAAAEKIFTSLGAELDLKKLREKQPTSPS
jgi:tetratricopeptide (TPR) repeat protein